MESCSTSTENAQGKTDAVSPINLTAPTGCPPPLAWTEVLANFRENSHSFEVGEGTSRISGATFGQGAPLYFLNGWSGDADLFCLTAWLLRDQFRCVVINYPQTARNVQSLSESLVKTATQLGDASVNLFGTGFGSVIALTSALLFPDRIERLILQSPLIRFELSTLERVVGRACTWLPRGIRKAPFRRQLVMANHRLWFPPIDQQRCQFLSENMMATPVSVVARRFLMLHKLDLAGRLNEVSCPTLIVNSEGDPQRSKDAGETLREKISGARYEMISNSGQIPFVTHPHRLANLIKPFVFGAQ